jgi:hypothetical protein
MSNDCTNKSFKVVKFENDFTIIYLRDKEHWEPPPVLAGWGRKNRDTSSPEAWVHVPRFLPCIYRVIRREADKQCGKIDLRIKCNKLGFTTGNAIACIDCKFQKS